MLGVHLLLLLSRILSLLLLIRLLLLVLLLLLSQSSLLLLLSGISLPLLVLLLAHVRLRGRGMTAAAPVARGAGAAHLLVVGLVLRKNLFPHLLSTLVDVGV